MIVNNRIPRHVAMIMDGNGRWAKKKGLPRAAGHRAGANRVKEIVRTAGNLGIQVVTFFAFSTENWSRPKGEIDTLMRLLDHFLSREIERLDKDNVRFMVIGRRDPLPLSVRKKIEDAQNRTKDNTGLTLALALNYGGRQEIVDAAKRFAQEALEGKVEIKDLDVDTFSNYFYTAGLADPDLLIRTSGEMRVSNFLLWQISYAELFFCDKYWPDFGSEDFKKAIQIYQERDRRYGAL